MLNFPCPKVALGPYDRVCILCKPSHGEKAVIRVDNDVCSLCIRKDGVCLDQLFGESIIHPFQDEATQS